MSSPIRFFSDIVFADTPLQKAHAIFIPGSHHPQLAEKAAQLYHSGLAPLIIPSGRANKYLPDNASEGSWLKSVLIGHGVPNQAIIEETKASNTFENADFTAALILQRDLNIQSAIIVAKGFHSRRCLLTYQTAFNPQFKFFVCTVPDGNGNTKDNWFTNTNGISSVMSEIGKIGRYFEIEVATFASYAEEEWS